MTPQDIFSELHKDLSDRQKGSIIACLVFLSQSKGIPPDADIRFLTQISQDLNFDFNNPVCRMMQESREELIIAELNAMNEGQKDWFAYTLYGMSMADGKMQDCELAVALDICNRIGISNERYVSNIKKVEALMKKFGIR
jgi:hypothetical protein